MGDGPLTEVQPTTEAWSPLGKVFVAGIFPKNLFDSTYWSIGTKFWIDQKRLAQEMGVDIVLQNVHDKDRLGSGKGIHSIGVGTAFLVSGDKASEYFAQFQNEYKKLEDEMTTHGGK